MNRALKKYRRHVKRRLRCVGRTRRTLLGRLDQDLARYAEEEPSASYSDAVLAIGAPMEVAAELNETLTEQDEARYRHRKWLRRGIVAAVSVLMVGYICFLWKALTTPFVIEQVTIIYEEQPDPVDSDPSATDTDPTETCETDPIETDETDATETDEADEQTNSADILSQQGGKQP